LQCLLVWQRRIEDVWLAVKPLWWQQRSATANKKRKQTHQQLVAQRSSSFQT